MGILLMELGFKPEENERKTLLLGFLKNHLVDVDFPNKFIGMDVRSFDRSSLMEIQQKRFLICEKSDGNRFLYLYYYDQKDNHFLIDRNNNFYKVSCDFSASRVPNLNNPRLPIILDGELVSDEVFGKTRLRFLIFDALMIDEPLLKLNYLERLKRVRSKIIVACGKHSAEPLDSSTHTHFELFLKDFYDVSSFSEVLKMSQNLPHDTDGIIFTPVDEPYQLGEVGNILKWKPPELNSIDFMPIYDENPHPHYKCGVVNKGYIIPFTTREGYHYFDGSEKTNNEIMQKMWRTSEIAPWSVLECRLSPQFPNMWLPFRIRADKKIPNSQFTAYRVFNSIKDGISPLDIEKAIRLVASPLSLQLKVGASSRRYLDSRDQSNSNANSRMLSHRGEATRHPVVPLPKSKQAEKEYQSFLSDLYQELLEFQKSTNDENGKPAIVKIGGVVDLDLLLSRLSTHLCSVSSSPTASTSAPKASGKEGDEVSPYYSLNPCNVMHTVKVDYLIRRNYFLLSEIRSATPLAPPSFYNPSLCTKEEEKSKKVVVDGSGLTFKTLTQLLQWQKEKKNEQQQEAIRREAEIKRRKEMEEIERQNQIEREEQNRVRLLTKPQGTSNLFEDDEQHLNFGGEEKEKTLFKGNHSFSKSSFEDQTMLRAAINNPSTPILNVSNADFNDDLIMEMSDDDDEETFGNQTAVSKSKSKTKKSKSSSDRKKKKSNRDQQTPSPPLSTSMQPPSEYPESPLAHQNSEPHSSLHDSRPYETLRDPQIKANKFVSTVSDDQRTHLDVQQQKQDERTNMNENIFHPQKRQLDDDDNRDSSSYNPAPTLSGMFNNVDDDEDEPQYNRKRIRLSVLKNTSASVSSPALTPSADQLPNTQLHPGSGEVGGDESLQGGSYEGHSNSRNSQQVEDSKSHDDLQQEFASQPVQQGTTTSNNEAQHDQDLQNHDNINIDDELFGFLSSPKNTSKNTFSSKNEFSSSCAALVETPEGDSFVPVSLRDPSSELPCAPLPSPQSAAPSLSVQDNPLSGLPAQSPSLVSSATLITHYPPLSTTGPTPFSSPPSNAIQPMMNHAVYLSLDNQTQEQEHNQLPEEQKQASDHVIHNNTSTSNEDSQFDKTTEYTHHQEASGDADQDDEEDESRDAAKKSLYSALYAFGAQEEDEDDDEEDESSDMDS
eukprot:GDKJ01058987.1.p1 GENE.GDKJ01058987.1~~GDKJ01058987.1.p1  ORF type:complete len:1168 (+),score=330.34 GDKJ01058987.1:1-3504(+)